MVSRKLFMRAAPSPVDICTSTTHTCSRAWVCQVRVCMCVCINHMHAFIHAYMQASIHTYCTHSSSSRQQDLALFNDTLWGLDLIVIHDLIAPVLNHLVQCPACPSECEFVRVWERIGDVAHAHSGCH